MRIALGQMNPTVGAISRNAQRIEREIRRAEAAGADLVVFPELAICGYPPKDLLLKPDFIRRCREAVDDLAANCRGVAALVGFPAEADADAGPRLHNAAAFCCDGEIRRTAAKHLLPTYDVFDESRYFRPGPPAELLDFAGLRLGVTICEDLWNDDSFFPQRLYERDPVADLVAAGAEAIVNLSASPFVLGKPEFRMGLLTHAATRHRVPIAYCNQVGGNDELLFDGHSAVLAADGRCLCRAAGFAEALVLADLAGDAPTLADADADEADEPTPATQPGAASPSAVEEAADEVETGTERPPSLNCVASIRSGEASLYDALTLGLRDYMAKCGFRKLVLGLSGGIDSAVTAALCVGAAGPDAVRGLAMPSRYSSGHSVDDARQLADNLGIRCDVIPIGPAHDAFETMLADVFEGCEPDVTEENIQARARGVTLMAVSNKFNALLVTTGNKSELAVGYCTLYGDMAGGLAALSDVPKTHVWRLARWINDDPASPLRRRFGGPVIPADSIEKPPSAELAADQVDADSLPPYAVLDEIIERYVVLEEPPEQIARAIEAFEEEEARRIVAEVVRLIDRNEYKRKQTPPGLKVTSRAFGSGRRMPIAQGYAGAASLTASAGRS